MAKIVAQTEFGYNSTFLVEMTEKEWKPSLLEDLKTMIALYEGNNQ